MCSSTFSHRALIVNSIITNVSETLALLQYIIVAKVFKGSVQILCYTEGISCLKLVQARGSSGIIVFNL